MTSQEFKLTGQSNSWMQIGLLAKRKDAVINNLFRHVNVENLREAYHTIDGSKAVGIDRITKDQYGKNIDKNLQLLVDRLHIGTYRPQAKRGVEIPKANGKTRLIAIGTFEDKLVEWVLAQILIQLYEPLFIETSYGFRPKRSTHQAIKTIFNSLIKKKRDYVVDIDIKSFFDTVSHRKLIKMLEKRINDNKLLSLVSRLLEVGVLVNGVTTDRQSGTPQGGIVSPILSNIYLHHALDVWFLENYAKAGGVISRYADDVVFVFKTEPEANRFMTEVKDRLLHFNLELNEEKSKKIDFGPRSGNVFHFTGFTFYWGKDRGSHTRRLKVKTQKERLNKSITEMNLWLKENRNKYNLQKIWDMISVKLRGHYNYFGVSCNRPKLVHFYYKVTGLLFKWLNRRSQKRSFIGEKFKRRLLNYPLPRVPDVRKLKHLIDREGFYVY
jgi:group II intron reverse transcriptase/maturase